MHQEHHALQAVPGAGPWAPLREVELSFAAILTCASDGERLSCLGRDRAT